METHPGEKNLGGVARGALIGVELPAGLYLVPSRGHSIPIAQASLGLFADGSCSQRQLQRLISVPHWLLRLSRCPYAIFLDVYQICGRRPEDLIVAVPSSVQDDGGFMRCAAAPKRMWAPVVTFVCVYLYPWPR